MTDLTLWRLSKKPYARSLFDGEGARRYGGRWGSKGTPLVFNYVLNLAHPRFDTLDVRAPETLPVDRRLVRP